MTTKKKTLHRSVAIMRERRKSSKQGTAQRKNHSEQALQTLAKGTAGTKAHESCSGVEAKKKNLEGTSILKSRAPVGSKRKEKLHHVGQKSRTDHMQTPIDSRMLNRSWESARAVQRVQRH